MSTPSSATNSPNDSGESPFRAKGLVYRGALEYLQKALPGGLETLRPALDPPLAQHLLDRPFMASSWYDALPLVPISKTAARIKGVTQAALVRANAAAIAERDLGGVYRFMLAVDSPGLAAVRLGRVSLQYFDFGSVEERREGENRHVTDRLGVPLRLADWFIWATQGFAPVILKAAGAQEVRVAVEQQEPDARFEGRPTVRIRFAFEWS